MCNIVEIDSLISKTCLLTNFRPSGFRAKFVKAAIFLYTLVFESSILNLKVLVVAAACSIIIIISKYILISISFIYIKLFYWCLSMFAFKFLFLELGNKKKKISIFHHGMKIMFFKFSFYLCSFE